MTDYIILQIIGILVFSIWIICLIEQLIKKGFNLEISILLIISIFLLAIIAIPNRISGLLNQIGFIRPLDAFLIIVSVTSLLLAGKIYVKQIESNRNITKIVQILAIKELDDNRDILGRDDEDTNR